MWTWIPCIRFEILGLKSFISESLRNGIFFLSIVYSVYCILRNSLMTQVQFVSVTMLLQCVVDYDVTTKNN